MKRTAFWILIFMICGIYSRLGISMWVCLVCFIFCMASVSYFVIKNKNYHFLLLLLAFLLGFGLAEKSATKTFVEMAGGNVAITASGIVTNAEKTKNGYWKCDISGTVTETENNMVHKNQKLLAIIKLDENVAMGDCITLSGDALAFAHPDIYGGYDEWLYLTAEGYTAKIFPDTWEKTGTGTFFGMTIKQANEKVQAVLDKLLPEKESGIAKAMLTGDRTDIGEETDELYTKAGVTHILCISGLHMSLFAFYLSYILRDLCKCSKRVTAFVTIVVCVGFLIFSGLKPSAMRAVVMISVTSLGYVVYRQHDWLNSLALAGILILLIQPLYLFQAGFQLSFASVLGIYIATHVLPKPKTWYAKIGNLAGISCFAVGFGLPIVAYHFYEVSFVGILANMVVLPLSGILLGSIVLSVMGGFLFLPLGVFLAGTVYFILQLFEMVCHLMIQIPYGIVTIGRMPLWSIAAYYLLWYALCFYRPNWKYRLMTFSSTMILLYAMLGNRLIWKENTVAFLDVGQGDCTVITTYDKRAFVIDGGGKYGKPLGENVGITVIAPYLASQGITDVEALFLTHLDADHSTGILELLAEGKGKDLYVSDCPVVDTEAAQQLKEIVEKNDVSVYTMHKGNDCTMESLGVLRCMYPIEDFYFDENSENVRSLVLQYVYGDTSVLLTGDIEVMQEAMLAKQEIQSDILKVAHHGSRTSSTPIFLDAVSAECGIISCGRNNLYNHPHTEVIERLENHNMDIYRTDISKSIIINIDPNGGYTVHTAAERKPYYETIKREMEKT